MRETTYDKQDKHMQWNEVDYEHVATPGGHLC